MYKRQEYYVDETGKMVTNTWLKLVLDDADIDDPNGDGEGWFWFDSKGKKVTDMKKTINGKVYYFDGDGVMEYGLSLIHIFPVVAPFLLTLLMTALAECRESGVK